MLECVPEILLVPVKKKETSYVILYTTIQFYMILKIHDFYRHYTNFAL